MTGEPTHSTTSKPADQRTPVTPDSDSFDQETSLPSLAQQMRLNPRLLTPTGILQLQRTIGNQATQNLLSIAKQPNGLNRSPTFGRISKAEVAIQRLWTPPDTDGISRWDTVIDNKQWYRRQSGGGFHYRWQDVSSGAGSLFEPPEAHGDVINELFEVVDGEGLHQTVNPQTLVKDVSGDIIQLGEELAGRTFVVENLIHKPPIGIYCPANTTNVLVELFDSQNRLAWRYAGRDIRIGNTALYRRHGFGTFTLKLYAFRQQEPTVFHELNFTVLGPGNPNVVRNAIPPGAQYVGSHWTATFYDQVFTQFGLREAGNDARFGEGLYTTTDENLGLLAGFSVLEANPRKQGLIREWRVFALPNTPLQGIAGTKEMSWQQTPYRDNPLVENYVRNYDMIVNDSEQEIKLNTVAFNKVIMIPAREIDPGNRDVMERIQRLKQQNMRH